MMGINEVLPMYPGYALGGIISETDLLVPAYEKKRRTVEGELLILSKQQEKEKTSEQFQAQDEKYKQVVECNHAQELFRKRKALDVICGKISELVKSDNDSYFPLLESLPFDDSQVKLRSENRSFRSTGLKQLIFTNHENVHDQIKTFVSELFLENVPVSILPIGTLESMSKMIESLLGTSKTSVTFVGCFATLERVKYIDPMIIRAGSQLSPELLKNASKYRVLVEAVLGAVFLGIGKNFHAEEKIPDKADKKWLSSMTTVQYISQGVIPKMNPKIEDVDLWSVFSEWLTALEDPKSGYPICFKTRGLESILKENNIIT